MGNIVKKHTWDQREAPHHCQFLKPKKGRISQIMTLAIALCVVMTGVYIAYAMKPQYKPINDPNMNIGSAPSSSRHQNEI